MTNLNFKEVFLQPVLSRKDSEADAFCIKDITYSYRQLYNLTEQIYLLVKDIQEENIGLYAVDDIRTYASIIALWACGKTYVPLNPNQPIERHVEVMTSIGSHYILSADEKYNIGLEQVNILSTQNTLTDSYNENGCLKIMDIEDTALAYIIFTSGSTGKPKGVAISRSNVVAFIDSMDQIGLSITEKDRCLQPFDLTFDFSVSSYVIPLVKGACIYTIPQKAIKFSYIAGLLEDYKLTVLQMVPSMVRNMLPYIDEIELGSVRYNIFCGEALTGKVISQWHKANPEMVSYNMYGPTEDTVFCTYYLIDKNNANNPLANNDIVSIGKTFINSGVILIDDNDRTIADCNKEGELCLCGSQLTPGYWNNPKENSSKFFIVDGVRYYRTGDLCFFGENQNLMYLNRKDFQVKINGFRVELGEIENRFSDISGGKFCIVLPYTNSQENTELAIVIEGDSYDFKEDKAKLSNSLPAYEIPNKWLFLKSIPLNTNGKVDRKKIKQILELS